MVHQSKKVLRNSHAKRYIQEVFAQRLIQEGFSTPDESMICWYRIKNREIVNAVYFYSKWSNLPLMMAIGYGIHPLFIRPFHSSDIYFSNIPIENEIFTEQLLVEKPLDASMRYMPYRNDALVYAPGRNGYGLYTFDEIILPLMDRVETIRDCYQLHKQTYLNTNLFPMGSRDVRISTTFIDEAIYMNDEELFSICRESVRKTLELYKDRTPAARDTAWLKTVEQQYSALFEGKRDAYLSVLESRKRRLIQKLEKQFGLKVDS